MAHILIIDDEEQIRVMLRWWFEKEGYTVTVAANGEEGLQCYRETSADLVITDLIMPEKEGIETIIELKEADPDIKIIAMSGGGRSNPHGYLDMAKQLGAVEIFHKPIKKEALVSVVNQLLLSSGSA